ncbi:hypothetical protein [Vibrio sp. WXL210]|uniref:hypothetical protein n=1 Tax=Vibrio sp. WXL210 TaxID=3450709 RepID=UPI003EC58D7F
MYMMKVKSTVILTIILFGVYGCGTTNVAQQASTNATVKVNEYNSAVFLSSAKPKYSKLIMENQTLKVEFEGVTAAQSNSRWPTARFFPKKGWWNWEDKEAIKFDITNPSQKPAKVVFKLTDKKGLSGIRANQLDYVVSLRPGEKKQIEMKLDGGLRKAPGYTGGTELDLQSLMELKMFVRGPVEPQTVYLENFQLVGSSKG